MAGGHTAGTGRRATAEFPADWDDRKILDNALDVARSPDQAPYRQRNGRWRMTGTRDGVDVDVVVEQSGRIRTVYPTDGDGVTWNADTSATKPSAVDLAEGAVVHLSSRVLRHLAGRISTVDHAHCARLYRAGEWEEFADVVAAHVREDDFTVSAAEYIDLELLLSCFRVPVPGYAYINDRDDILRALRARR